jgi:putative toxin-antitoxin system antitoxin component (TIGR02293 family)
MIETLTKPGLKKWIGTAAGHPRSGQRPAKRAGGGAAGFRAGGATGGIAASKLIKMIQAGLPARELKDLQTNLDVPMEKLVPMLGISKATLHRRMAGGRLGPAESDRVVRLARLMDKAVAVMESVESARRWLTSPQFGLGGAVPLDYAGTEVGAREVEDLLGRIEDGVYS